LKIQTTSAWLDHHRYVQLTSLPVKFNDVDILRVAPKDDIKQTEVPRVLPVALSTVSNDGDDVRLPDYSCTVHKEGYIHQKMEMEDFQPVSKSNFKRVYIVIWGTLIKEFEKPPRSLVIVHYTVYLG
jgi:hypothetical protein